MRKNPTVVFTEPGKVVIEDKSVKKPGEGQLLVKTSRTLISTGTELTILSGEFPKNSRWAAYGKYPFVAGYDNVGVVVEVGKGVDSEWIDRRVASYGSHAAFVFIPASQARSIPDKVTDDEAVFFTIAEITMNGVRRGGVTWGEAVVIYGLGLLGQLTARFCHLAGARPIVGVDVSDSRIELLPKVPGLIGVNPKNEDVHDIVKDLTRGRMADVVFEVTGNPDLIPQEFNALKNQGRFVVLSGPRGPSNFDFHNLCNSPSYTIIGAHNSSHPPVATPLNQWTQIRHAELFFDLLSDNQIDVNRLISNQIPYTEAPAVYAKLKKDRTQFMGVILDWSDS